MWACAQRDRPCWADWPWASSSLGCFWLDFAPTQPDARRAAVRCPIRSDSSCTSSMRFRSSSHELKVACRKKGQFWHTTMKLHCTFASTSSSAELTRSFFLRSWSNLAFLISLNNAFSTYCHTLHWFTVSSINGFVNFQGHGGPHGIRALHSLARNQWTVHKLEPLHKALSQRRISGHIPKHTNVVVDVGAQVSVQHAMNFGKHLKQQQMTRYQGSWWIFASCARGTFRCLSS